MTRDRDREWTDRGSGLLPPLDAEPGPMPPLSAAEADAIAWGAVSQWAAGLPGVEPPDDGVGPARPMSSQGAEHMAQRVVALRAARSRTAWLQPWAAKAATVLLACGITAASFAAYRLWPTVKPPTPPPTAATRSIPHRAPNPEPKPEPEPEPELTPQTPPPEEKPDPESLLARANALRAQRRWAAADHVYRQALASSATPAQRYVALVASASINLQHLGKPARALASYQSALSLVPNGALSEEAHFGIAECQRALGDRALELRALDVFIAQHPDSPLLDVAQKRRAELQ